MKKVVAEGDTTQLKNRLEKVLAENEQPIQFLVKDELLILTLSDPDFHFYLSFINNEPKSLREYKQLAEDFELPWDAKPVDDNRLQKIFLQLEKEGWEEYKPFHEIGHKILQEIKNCGAITFYSIPSMKTQG